MRALVVLLIVVFVAETAVAQHHAASAVEPNAEGRRRRSVRSPGTAPTSFALIDRAVASGAISEETGVVYKVYTIFADPRLPAEFRGKDRNTGDTLYLSDVAARYDTFSPETQNIVRPFLIPPMHEASWFYHQPRPGAAGSVTTTAKPCDNCDKIGQEWASIATRNGKVKIWFQLRYGESEAAIASAFADEIDDVIWPRLKTFMLGREPNPDWGDRFIGGSNWGGDSRLDIALVDGTDIDTTLGHGVTRSAATSRYSVTSGCVGMVNILLKRGTPKQELAHELMHAFQNAFVVKVHNGDCQAYPEYGWLMDATAEWVKDAIPEYRSSNDEQFFAKFFMNEVHESLEHYDPSSNERAYGAYLLPFFLTRVKNVGPTVVGHMWAATERLGSLDAVDEALRFAGYNGFQAAWPEFARYNLNRTPVDDYDKLDQLKDRAPVTSRRTPHGKPDEHVPLSFELPHLSAVYVRAAITSDARSFAFLNGYTFRLSTTVPAGEEAFGLRYTTEALSDGDRHGRSVWAIVKKGGQWQNPDDWSDRPSVNFCLDAADRIEEVVLIFTNDDKTAGRVTRPADLPPMFVSSNMACKGWKGTATWVADTTDGGDPITVTWTIEATRVEPPAGEPRLMQSYALKSSAKWSVSGRTGDCTYSGSGSLTGRESLYGAGLNFAPPQSASYRRVFLIAQSMDPRIQYQKNCGDGGYTATGAVPGFPHWLGDILLPVDATGVLLEGSKVFEHEGMVFGRWRWAFEAIE